MNQTVKRHDNQLSDLDGRGRGNVPELRVLVAGAGTGGHLFPGIAIVEKLMMLKNNVKPCFVTTGRPIEDTVLGQKQFDTVRISAAGLKGFSITGKARSLGMLTKGFLEARGILKTFNPHMVLGMGGYSSAPVIMAAWMMGIPRVIHEQNRIPGITNRVLSRLSDRVYVSFADTDIPGAKGKIRFSGYPVRHDIVQAANFAGKTVVVKEFSAGKPMTLLVLGGSQGAHRINRAMTEAMDYLANTEVFEVVHQSGAADEEYVRGEYERKGVKAFVSAFFTDMETLYRKADLAISRAGAGTLAELAMARLPAVLVPYPHAADNHQLANANGMAKTGGVRILLEKDLTPKELAALIEHYREDPDALSEMKSNFEKHGAGNDPARIIAEDILEMVGFPSVE